MANIPGSVPIAGFVAPTDDQDTYAVTDSKYNRGGFRAVATLVERDDIFNDRRREGMIVYVIENDTEYQLKGGISNNDWVIRSSGGGGEGRLYENVVFVDKDSPEIPGVRYQSYDAAADYIQANYAPSYYHRWYCMFIGWNWANVTIRPYIGAVGAPAGSSVVTGTITTEDTDNYDCYVIKDLVIGAVDTGDNVDIFLKVANCFIVSQSVTSGTGTIWLTDNTEVWSVSTPNYAEMASLKEVIVNGSSMLYELNTAKKLTLWSDGYANLYGNNALISTVEFHSGSYFQLWKNGTIGSGVVSASDFVGWDLTLTVTGTLSITQTSIADMNIIVDAGELKTKGITLANAELIKTNGGTISNDGIFYDNTNSWITKKDTQGAIDQLMAQVPQKNIRFVSEGQSIQSAIDDLEASGGFTDDVQALVVIGPGFYEEDITMKSMIHLVSFTTGRNNYTANIKGTITVDLQLLPGVSLELKSSLIGLYMRSGDSGTPGPIIHFTGNHKQRLYIANCAVGCSPTEYSTALLCDNTNSGSRLNIEDAVFSYGSNVTNHGGAMIDIQTNVYTLLENNCMINASQITQAPYPPALHVANADVLLNNSQARGHIIIDSGGVTMNNLILTVEDPDASAIDIAISGYAYLSGALKLAQGTTSQYAVTGTGLFGYGVTQYLGADEPYAPTLSIGQGGLTLPVVDGAQIIKYRPEDENWDVRSVKAALDDIRENGVGGGAPLEFQVEQGDLINNRYNADHNAGYQYPVVEIVDDNNNKIMPTGIFYPNENTAVIDFTGLTITNKWRVLVYVRTAANDIYEQQFVASDLSGGKLTLDHGLTYQYPVIRVVDDGNHIILPTDILYDTLDTAIIDLTGITITNNWRAIASLP